MRSIPRPILSGSEEELGRQSAGIHDSCVSVFAERSYDVGMWFGKVDAVVAFSLVLANGKGELFAIERELRVDTRFVSAGVDPDPTAVESKSVSR